MPWSQAGEETTGAQFPCSRLPSRAVVLSDAPGNGALELRPPGDTYALDIKVPESACAQGLTEC